MPQVILPPNTSFSQQIPHLQLYWDSTSLGALKTCPRYYEYVIVRGYGGSGRANAHLFFGQEYHAGLELYDRLKAQGKSHEEAVLSSVKALLISTWDFDLKRPWISEEPTKNRDSLIRSIIWYLDQFENDPLETIILANGQPAVELSFRFEPNLQSDEDEEFFLCGHLDRMVTYQDRPWILDRKTSKSYLNERYFSHFSPDNQMSLYDIAGKVVYREPVAGIIIDAAQILVEGTRFQRGFISRSEGQREEWLRDLIFWLANAQTYAQQEYWPLNDRSCQQYGGCPFIPVCGSAPQVRDRLLDGLFQKRIWDPRVTREV